MNRDEIEGGLLRIFREEFEIVSPGLDDNLREVHGFDSIDGIELLREIEIMTDVELTRDQKEVAMEIQTLNQLFTYVESLVPQH